MPYSSEFQKLEERLLYLQQEILPQISETGDYSPKESDQIRGYVLLVHAEIESYFESISERVSKESYLIWKENRSRSRVLLSLVAFSEKKLSSDDIEKRTHDALSHHIYKLKKNNGIKDDDVLSMLLPIGIEKDKIDSTWLTTIKEFGIFRGAIAHTSYSVQNVLDPITIINSIRQILDGIIEIERAIQEVIA